MLNHYENLLIIRPGALGDTLMLLPLLAALQGRVQVSVAARRPGLDFLRSHSARCLDMEAAPWHVLFESEPDARRFDLPMLRPRQVLAFLSDPDGLVERNLDRFFPEARVGVFAGRPGTDAPEHAALHLARCAAGAGLPVNPESCLEQARRVPLLRAGPRSDPGRGVVIHPGSGGRRKNLSPEFWLAFMERVLREGDMTVLLGPAEEALRSRFEQRISGRPVRMEFCPETKVLRSLLERAELYIGHDSGVTHLAAMLGTPVLAVFRGGDSRIWGPLGPRVRVMHVREEAPDLMEQVVRATGAAAGKAGGMAKARTGRVV